MPPSHTSDNTPRLVLGVHGWSADSDKTQVHDAGAALIRDGEVVAAVNEERLSRVKNHGGFPNQSIAAVLDLAGATFDEVDLVAMAGLDRPERGRRLCRYLAETFADTRVFIPRRWGGALRDLMFRPRRQLPAGVAGKPVRFVEHHQAHAASAYYASPWEEATIITLDGVGDDLCATVNLGSGGAIQRLYACNGYYSPGVLYSAVTLGLGFKKNRHEGKITGLAAYGDPKLHIPAFRQVLQYQDDKRRFFAPEIARNFRDLQRNTAFLDHLMRSGKPEDIAAAAQQLIEEVVVAFCRDAVRATGQSRVVVAGGVFANVKLNQRLIALEEVENLYIHPNMGDGGLGTGAALQTLADLDGSQHPPLKPNFLQTVYLGPEWSDDQVKAILDRQGRTYTAHENIEEKIADLLAAGRVVGRFAGRMEYGPRALGNRSILVRPTDPAVNDWLNERLHRSEFMPFAPSTLEEAAADHYIGWRPDHVAARFMTITYDTTPQARKSAPATIHVDHTARPQIVRQQDNPSYHRIIRRFAEKTGIPSIINTSFNMHEEPIVCSPEDALRALDEGGVEILAINRFLVEPRTP